jgi:hypothetical protein
MAQQVLADRLGKSRSWVDKVERGVRRIDRYVVHEIADVLQVDAQLLLGRDAPRPAGLTSEIAQDDIEQIQAVLERYDQMSAFFAPVTRTPTLAATSRAVRDAHLAYQQARYGALARSLPHLLQDVQALDSTHAGSTDTLEAARLLSEVYQIAAGVLRKVGEYELSWIASDRSIAATARPAGRPGPSAKRSQRATAFCSSVGTTSAPVRRAPSRVRSARAPQAIAVTRVMSSISGTRSAG